MVEDVNNAINASSVMQKYVIAKELVADIVSQAEILKCNVINYANNTCQTTHANLLSCQHLQLKGTSTENPDMYIRLATTKQI
jgi:hypothetical protein